MNAMNDMMVLAGNALKRVETDGAVFTMRLALARLIALGRSFLSDRRLGVSTASVVKEQEPEIADPRCHWYLATDYETFDLAMEHVAIRPGEDVFVDLGSGMGRAVVLAAQRPFRRVVGVEFSRRLHAVAEENVRVSRPRARCREIDLVLADATQWRVPDDASILFFFNPFHGEVLAKVCDNIRRSLAEAPRRLTIVYVRPEKFFEREIDWRQWLVRTHELRCLEGKVCIYESIA